MSSSRETPSIYSYMMNIINVGIIKISVFHNIAYITVLFASHNLAESEGFLTQPKHVADLNKCYARRMFIGVFVGGITSN